jgi:Zn-dependent protease
MLAPFALVCPQCATLVHAEELKRLSREATEAGLVGDTSTALARWREALRYLPVESRQYESVTRRIQGLSLELTEGVRSPPEPAVAEPPVAPQAKSRVPKPLAALGAVGAFIWKMKFIAVAVLSKAKLLLLGLTKLSTVLSMALTFGVYWGAFGWKFALGVVVTTYVHEMGHVSALRKFGIPATAPMFIPGFGALVRLKQYPSTVQEDARIGLAGPVWGAGAAVVSVALYWITGAGFFAATAVVTAWINFFNLIPIFTLDGGRGFRALSRDFRFVVSAAALAAAAWAHDSGMLYAVGGIGLVRAFGKDAPAVGDRMALATFLTVLAVLASIIVLLGDQGHSPFLPNGN